MIAFRHVLCPIDFSEIATRALVHAAAIAKWYEARLTLLHVVPAVIDTWESSLPLMPDGGRTPFASVCADVVEKLRRAAEEAGAAPRNLALLAEEGRTHAVIVDRATSLQADLLVLGTHGRGGFDRLVLGSVAEKVVRTAPCPVLTVPPAAPATTQTPVVFKNIVCPIDFSPSSLKALEYALDLGRQANGRVTLVHALEYMDAEDASEHWDASIRHARQHIIDNARERLHAIVAGESQTWCDLDEVVTIDRAYKATLRTAKATEADLIVMGAQGRGSVDLMLYGSNTQHVVRVATCPVLTVRS